MSKHTAQNAYVTFGNDAFYYVVPVTAAGQVAPPPVTLHRAQRATVMMPIEITVTPRAPA
jgi:hypothetical protein